MKHAPRVLVLASPFVGYLRGLIRGVARYAQANGPWEFYVSGLTPGVPMPALQTLGGGLLVSSTSRRRPARLLDEIRRWGITGIIGRLSSTDLAEAVLESGLPAIALDLNMAQRAAGHPLAELAEATSDCHGAGRLAAEHLLDLGLRRFGFLGRKGQVWSDRREAGFRGRLAEAGFDYDTFSTPHTRRRDKALRNRIRLASWLRDFAKPVGIFAANDYVGREVLDVSAEAGIDVPDAVAVVGADDDHLADELANPPLSSVAFNTADGGYRIADLLDRMMAAAGRWQSVEPRRIVIGAVRVVARRSSDAVAVDDPVVAKALRFIRSHVREPIRVAHVVQQCGVSHRSLTLHFQAAIGHSVRAELQRVRIEWAKRLLSETNLSGEKVAENAGFSSLSYFCHAFRRATGATPAQYRCQHRAR